MSNKREYYSSSRLRTRFVPRKVGEVVEAYGTSSGSADMGSPSSFTKVLKSKYQIHTSMNQCALILPRQFCDKHNVANHVTMTDSTGHTLWHMRCNNRMVTGGQYKITNGWREFSYDHSLKQNDKLVFTLVSPSHFVVEFETRVMRPTRDGKKCPWVLGRNSRTWVNYSENVQGVAMATTILPIPSKQTNSKGEMLCQSNTVKIENRKSNSKDISRRLRKGLVPSKVSEVLEATSTSSGSAEMSTPSRFTKVLTSKYQIHTSIRQCTLSLPRPFCDKHNVANNVTMTDSTGHTLGHMRCQNRMVTRGTYRMSNGWREFSYDHSLKRNDKLVFTLVSPSHFVVEFAASKEFTRVMRPTRNGKKYPWVLRRNCRAWVNCSKNVQGVARATTIKLPLPSKQTPEGEMLCQCNTVKIENQKRNSKDSTKMRIHLPELTHLECKNPDGTSYLQILDSDSEVADESEVKGMRKYRK